MLSPLFFNSMPCRDEVRQFIHHERGLNKDDLILPVYFIELPKVEKEEWRNDDLVKEVLKRQMFDWREQANVPLQEPVARKAILKLAGKIAVALERLETSESPQSASHLRPGGGYDFLEIDRRLSNGIVGNPKREKANPRKILWVDDSPDNNVWESRALETYGVRFVYALDTPQAQQLLLEQGPFAAIISDRGRVGDPNAGFTLLELIRRARNDTPYFIYTMGGAAAKLGRIAVERGAQGITGDPDVLIEMVVTLLSRTREWACLATTTGPAM
jgi:CheY-like chemotaxis protein